MQLVSQCKKRKTENTPTLTAENTEADVRESQNQTHLLSMQNVCDFSFQKLASETIREAPFFPDFLIACIGQSSLLLET